MKFSRKWRNLIGGLVLIGLGAFGLATGKIQEGIQAIMKGAETITQPTDDETSVMPAIPQGLPLQPTPHIDNKA